MIMCLMKKTPAARAAPPPKRCRRALLRWLAAGRLVLVLALAGGSWLARGQEYLVKTWEVDDGLPESGVTDVAQSADGYLWVGTLNSGLSRFDGVRFVNFDSVNTPQLAGRGVRRLITDTEGDLWINGFGNYLATWRAGRFQPEYPGPAIITSLVASSPKRVVFATQDGNLLQGTRVSETKRKWEKILLPGAGEGANIRFYADQQGRIWYRGTNTQAIRQPGAADIGPVTALAGDDQGVIAFGRQQRLFLWVNGHLEDQTPTNGESELAVQGLVSDGLGGW